jgi:hypothetical protein
MVMTVVVIFGNGQGDIEETIVNEHPQLPLKSRTPLYHYKSPIFITTGAPKSTTTMPNM